MLVKIDETQPADGPSGFWRAVSPIVQNTITPKIHKDQIETLFEISSIKATKDTKKLQEKTEGPRVLNGQRMLQVRSLCVSEFEWSVSVNVRMVVRGHTCSAYLLM